MFLGCFSSARTGNLSLYDGTSVVRNPVKAFNRFKKEGNMGRAVIEGFMHLLQRKCLQSEVY